MKTILLTLLALPFLVLVVRAEDKPAKPVEPAVQPADPGAKPQTLDAKPDKPKIDPAEAFAKMDKNGDKKVDIAEFKASPRWKKDPAKADEMFKTRDKNTDGGIDLEEFTAKPNNKKPKNP